MGQQFNKHEKRQRRAKYHKRLKTRNKANAGGKSATKKSG